MLALLGRNGAGKTTCISTIIGFLRPRDGEISLFGEPIGGLSPERISRLGIGLVPQGRRIFPSLTVRENLVVAQQRETQRRKAMECRADLPRCFHGCANATRQFAGTLSGGEQQMLAIGRALMGNPRVLLLDEPSEGLAPLIVAEVGRTIQRLKEEGSPSSWSNRTASWRSMSRIRRSSSTPGAACSPGTASELLNNEELIAQNLGVFHAH